MYNDSFPLIVDIKRGSLEDGPGIRSVVFFKGCPLRCVFCHSPETQDPKAEVIYFADKCSKCRKCVSSCPQGAIDHSRPERIDRNKCDGCGQCVSVCPGKGLRLIGKYHPVEDLVEILLRDLPFYRHSDGGVTISGGECTLYPNYLESLLKSLKARQIHITLETCGYFSYGIFSRKILPYVDLVYFDVKIADPEIHQKHTGKKNHKILDNLYRLLREKPVVIHPRIPLIPDVTATRENLSAIVDLLCEAGAENVSLLPYNPLGIEMTERLGRCRPALPERFMTPDEERTVHNTFRKIIDQKECKNISPPTKTTVNSH